MRAIGAAWAAGEIDVAKEHAASETVRRRLARFFDAAASLTEASADAPQVIVGSPPGSLHELGSFAFAVACRRAGVRVLYLGANVPLESWLGAVRETGAAVVVMAAVTPTDVPSVIAVLEALVSLPGARTCLVGGAYAHDVPERLGAIHLAQPIEDALVGLLAILEPTAAPA